MPLARYQIRNEFNLADPDLYRAADKDDPEALLEGVAMAGLVGLLRQLGDLAEFAAEIFHDLHEEVMATAARGHGLMGRIQQLEMDVPLIEKKLLSHTNHTPFYYNTGDDWHPHLCMDQNLITQGDMPRFIRDSYEECRGPPQLFLLDKFDIGGAGACLKRYTDPSSFKAEPTTSDTAKLEVQRDRRTQNIKKRGYRWKNGDTPEVMTTSHAKLHQLLLEERIEIGNQGPTRLVKLKKRLLDGSNRSKSYMEKFLHGMSPEHPEAYEMEVGPPTLRLTYNHSSDQEHEILDIQPVSTTEDSVYYSPIDRNTKSRRSVRNYCDFNNRRRVKESLSSADDGNTIEIASHLHLPVSEKELGVDGESRKEMRVICSSSDDIASETDNYMDALANMESEGEVDNEYIAKNNLRYRSISKLGVWDSHEGSQMDREKYLDSHSIDYSNTSDDGRISFVKGTSSSSSHDAQYYAPRTNVQYRDRVAERFASTEIFEDVMVDYPHCHDVKEAQERTSNEYRAANGCAVNSIDAPFRSDVGDTSFHKDPSLLLQSSNSRLCLRQASPDEIQLKATSSESILDSDFPQGDRNGIYQGADIHIDILLNVVNNSVGRSSIQGRELEDSTDVLMHCSNNLNLDPPGGETTENGMHQKVYDDDVSSESMTFEDTASPQSVVSDYRQQPLPKVFDIEPFSHATAASADHALHDGNSDIRVLVDVSGEPASGEEMDDGDHVLSSSQETNGSFSVDAPQNEVKADDVNGLYTGKRELAAAISLFDCVDGKGHGGSSNISLGSVPLDTVVLEETDFGCKSDDVAAVLPPDYSSPSMDGHSSQASMSGSDDLHLGVVQRLESGSPRYPVNLDTKTELNEVSESRIDQDVSFELSDLDIKAFSDVLGQTLDIHESDRLPFENATASTSLRMEDPISEPVNHLLFTYDSSSSAPLSRDSQFYPEEAVEKRSDPHYGQLYSPEEAPAAEISSQHSSLKVVGDEEVMKEGVSLSQEQEIKPEGMPPLPPMQWMLGKLQESSLDSETKLDDSVLRPVGSLAPSTIDGKGGFPVSALDREVEQPETVALIDESLQHTSVPYVGDSPNSTDPAVQMKDSVDDAQSQHSAFKRDPVTVDENIESDTLAFKGETGHPSPASQLRWLSRDTDTSTRSEIQPSDAPNFPLPPLVKTTISTGDTIPTSLLAPSMIETIDPSSILPCPVPTSGETLDSKSNTSVAEVTFHFTDQSQEETTSYSNKPDQALESSEGRTLNRPERPDPQAGNEEAPKQENEPSEREATWSLSLPNYNNGNQVDKQAPKPPRPRNPLTESADALDRTKLKKVMPRSQPEIPRADDRGSFLEHIRAKSFNLKPAPAPMAKPFIHAPSMNLKVVSILEKVKKLRRDTAGSDDENDWSDD